MDISALTMDDSAGSSVSHDAEQPFDHTRQRLLVPAYRLDSTLGIVLTMVHITLSDRAIDPSHGRVGIHSANLKGCFQINCLRHHRRPLSRCGWQQFAHSPSKAPRES